MGMRTNRKGTAAVEFALVAPLLCIMILGMLEMGRALQVQQALTNAVREGCRGYCDNPTTVQLGGQGPSYTTNTPAYAIALVQYSLENANVGITTSNIGSVTVTASTSTPVKYGNTTVTASDGHGYVAVLVGCLFSAVHPGIAEPDGEHYHESTTTVTLLWSTCTMSQQPSKPKQRRRGAIAVLAALMCVILLGMIAFAVDIGYLAMARTQLQAAADSAALAAAVVANQGQSTAFAVASMSPRNNTVAGRSVQIASADVQFGTWDTSSRTFTQSSTPGNAVQVTVRTNAANGGSYRAVFWADIRHDRRRTKRPPPWPP